MRRHRHQRRHIAIAALAALALVAVLSANAVSADAGRAGYRIGSAVSANRAGTTRTSPSPTPPTSAPVPTTSTTSSPAGDSSAPGSSAPDSATSSASATNEPTLTSDPAATSAPGSTAPAPAGPTCGGSTLLKPDGSAWVCSFDDEFDGTTVDRSKWTVMTTAASGFHSGAECFMDSPSNVAVASGTLRLTARKESSPFTCATPSGGYTTQYTSGTVNGFGKYSQTYGRFEVRAKLPSTAIKGLQETLWLWPANSTKYGLWPASGEIDFAEFYSQYQGWNIPYLHYNVLQSTASWASNTNVYTALPYPNNQPGMNCTYKSGAFNNYTVVWQPGRIVLQINGQSCIVDNYSATNVASPAPFDQPFFLALTQALGIGGNAFVDGTTPLPATTEVDYVRIWK